MPCSVVIHFSSTRFFPCNTISYVETIRCPTFPTRVTLQLEMWNEHLQHFEDTLSLGLNDKFYVGLNYVVLIPLFISNIILYFTLRDK